MGRSILLGQVLTARPWGNPDSRGATLVLAAVELLPGAVLLGLALRRRAIDARPGGFPAPVTQ